MARKIFVAPSFLRPWNAWDAPSGDRTSRRQPPCAERPKSAEEPGTLLDAMASRLDGIAMSS